MSIGLATKGIICRGGGTVVGGGGGGTIFIPFGGFAIRLGEINPDLNVQTIKRKDINIEIKKPIKDFKIKFRLTTD